MIYEDKENFLVFRATTAHFDSGNRQTFFCTTGVPTVRNRSRFVERLCTFCLCFFPGERNHAPEECTRFREQLSLQVHNYGAYEPQNEDKADFRQRILYGVKKSFCVRMFWMKMRLIRWFKRLPGLDWKGIATAFQIGSFSQRYWRWALDSWNAMVE